MNYTIRNRKGVYWVITTPLEEKEKDIQYSYENWENKFVHKKVEDYFLDYFLIRASQGSYPLIRKSLLNED